MTLNFQNKIVFPAPACSYTSETAYGQVLYIPRNLKVKNTRAKVIGEDNLGTIDRAATYGR